MQKHMRPRFRLGISRGSSVLLIHSQSWGRTQDPSKREVLGRLPLEPRQRSTHNRSQRIQRVVREWQINSSVRLRPSLAAPNAFRLGGHMAYYAVNFFSMRTTPECTPDRALSTRVPNQHCPVFGSGVCVCGGGGLGGGKGPGRGGRIMEDMCYEKR